MVVVIVSLNFLRLRVMRVMSGIMNSVFDDHCNNNSLFSCLFPTSL